MLKPDKDDAKNAPNLCRVHPEKLRQMLVACERPGNATPGLKALMRRKKALAKVH